MAFEKTPLTTEQMIARLISHGMNINDLEIAKSILNQINYYRLSQYWFPFKVEGGETSTDYIYRNGTNFDEIVTIYEFDSDLRNILAQALEKFEVVLRREFSSVLSLKYDPFPHLDKKHYKLEEKWQSGLNSLTKAFNESKEEYVKHYKTKYPELQLPPIWVVAEISSFGYLSKTIENLVRVEDRQAIANRFFVDETIFCSSLKHLNLLRNFVAHHARVWNRRFFVRMQIPRNRKAKEHIQHQFNLDSPDKIYNTLVLLDYYLACIGDEFKLLEKVQQLLIKYPTIDKKLMGFPA